MPVDVDNLDGAIGEHTQGECTLCQIFESGHRGLAYSGLGRGTTLREAGTLRRDSTGHSPSPVPSRAGDKAALISGCQSRPKPGALAARGAVRWTP
jgi:hypothetical protein